MVLIRFKLFVGACNLFMNIKIASTGIISAEMIFKDYITFKWNIVYLTEDVLEHVAKYFQNNRYNVKIPRINIEDRKSVV